MAEDGRTGAAGGDAQGGEPPGATLPRAPLPGELPAHPASWYLFGAVSELAKGPVSKDLLGRKLVAFRTASGEYAILDGRCVHLGTDLGLGTVRGESIQCPFHNWEYGTHGRCTRIPAGLPIPDFAKLTSYPVTARHGYLYFFDGPLPLFPLPFFDGEDPDDFVPAEPFQSILECPWYLVGANAFDIQHFLGAHDRPLLDTPKVEVLSPYTRRITLPLSVGGDTVGDHLIRRVCGPEVRMSFTDWCGNLVFSVARFRRGTGRGLVHIRPLAPSRVAVQVMVYVPRSRGAAGRAVLDPLHLRVRRYFIRRFLSPDAELGSEGLRYSPHSFVESDRVMVDYFRWLTTIPRDAGRTEIQPLSSPAPSLEISAVAPPASAFPGAPLSWYLYGDVKELERGPLARDFLGRPTVAFRTASGGIGVIDARCSHMGADLSLGQVVGDSIRCPFHGWEYGHDGRCRRIPGQDAIPPGARQMAFTAQERHGLIFVYNAPTPGFPLPFFEDHHPDEFVRSRPFGMQLDCPWYMVGANAFDVQHFMGAHDRRLSGPSSVDYPHPRACRASAPFAVLGDTLRDRLTLHFAGDTVRLSITDWCGTLMFVTASFRRTRSYGMLVARPEAGGSYAQGVVFVKKSRSAAGRLLFDPLHLRVRRHFVKEFLRADAQLAAKGFRYRPGTLLECDADLARYFEWLARATAP